jgi:hypothetical protein
MNIILIVFGAVGGLGMMVGVAATIARAVTLIKPPTPTTRQSSPPRRLHLVAVGGKTTSPPPHQVQPIRNPRTLYLALRNHIRVTAAFTCCLILSVVALSSVRGAS